jgi:hypothetical protein
MTVKEFWQKTKARVVANWGRFERLLAITVDEALTTLQTSWKALQTYVSVPKHFLWVTLGGILVYDVFSKGANGSIAFLVKAVTDVAHAVTQGQGNAWAIVAIAALFLLKDKK